MMENPSLGIGDVIAITCVLGISLAIGIYFWFTARKQKTTKEYLMAGGSMSSFPVVFSLVVTFVSGIMMLGAPSEIYLFGCYRILSYFANCCGIVVSAYMFLPVYFQCGKSVSVYEYLEKRFGKITRNVASVLFIFQMILYIAVVLYAPALALNAVTGWSTWTSVITIGVVCTFYCTVGGLKAVLWTDVFQALVMYICVFAVLIQGIIDKGSLYEILRISSEGGRLSVFEFSFSLTKRYTVWNSLTFGFIFGLCNYGCNQAQVQRMLSVKNLKTSQRAVLLSVPLAIVFILINFSLGLIMYANYHDCDPVLKPNEPKITKMDQVLPFFIITNLNKFPGLAGLCIAGIFCGSLSTISSAVNSLAAVTMEDFIRPYWICKTKLTESQSAMLAKMLACTYGIAGIIFSYVVANFKGILQAHNVLFGIIAGPVLGLFTLGVMTTRSNEKGAVSGLVIGFLVASWIGFGSSIYNVKSVPLPRSISGCDFLSNASFTTTTTLNPIEHTLDPNTLNTLDASIDNISEPLIIYKLSFMWFATIGFVLTVVFGYLISVATSWNEKKRSIDPVLISPFVRKMYFKHLPLGTVTEMEKLNSTPAET